TDLTINSFTLSDPVHFSLGKSGPLTIAKGGSVLLPITVSGVDLGPLASTLTLFTDQSVALGGVGDTFTYNLTAMVIPAPEPASIAVLGAGLAGLAFATRRRRG
ncbi:MAG: PEP-CTERM sorting domain-containing protein, partial [Acetobacteraceae bacterium]